MALIADETLLPLFTFSLVAFVCYAAYKNVNWEHKGSVKRGDVANRWLYWFYGFGSVGVLQIVNASDALEGYKIIVSVLCLGSIMYLLFLNGWFRNRVLGWKRWYEERKD